MNYYQHHIGDFIRDTSRLSDSQCMAYLRLIWMYYESEKPLPNNPRSLALRIGSTQDDVSLLLEAFFTLENDKWKHSRCESEIAGYRAICNRNKTNGGAGGRPKKTQWVSSGNPEETVSEPHRNPIQEPVSSNHKPVTNNQEPETKGKKQTPNKSARFDPLAIPLPDCIKPSAWESWIEYRRARKLTCAEPTMKSQLQNLEAWWNEGHEPNSIMQASITNGWQGLFAPKLPFESKPVEDTSETNRRLAELVSRKFNLVGGGS